MKSAAAFSVLSFAWAVALTVHPLPGSPIERLGAGEWLFPIVVAATIARIAPVIRREPRALEIREALAPALVLAMGFVPAVAFATSVRAASAQWVAIVYVAAIFAVGRVLASFDRRIATLLLAGLVAGGSMRVVWAWAAPSFIPWMSGHWPRPLGGAESPNMVAIQAAVAIFALAVLRPRWWGIGALFFGVTILATLGHVVFAALVAASFAAWQWSLRRAPPLPRSVVGLAATSIVATTLLLVVSLRVFLLPLHATPPFIDTTPSTYAATHTLAIETFAAHPLTGVGLKGFHDEWRARDASKRFADRAPAGCNCTPDVPLDPHSTWLGALAEGGVLAGIAVLALAVLAMRAARRRNDPVLHAALAFAGASTVMVDLLTNRELALLLGVLLGGHSFASPRAKIDAT